eukprot:scaffold8536_cov36-Cyclotella_meneghiniana.AAC.12
MAIGGRREDGGLAEEAGDWQSPGKPNGAGGDNLSHLIEGPVIVVDRGVTMVRVKREEDHEIVGDWWEARRWGAGGWQSSGKRQA